MTTFSSKGLSRRALLGAFAASAVAAAPTYSNAFGLLRGAGDIRRIRMYSGRTGESMDTIYWIEGDYIKDALKEINYFMRDWRTDQTVGIDARTVDIMAASHSLLNVNEPYMLLSGYRSPQTNAMLRSRSSGVATQLAAYEGSGRRPAAEVALGFADGSGRGRLRVWWRRHLFPFELRAYGLRYRAHLARIVTPATREQAPQSAALFFVAAIPAHQVKRPFAARSTQASKGNATERSPHAHQSGLALSPRHRNGLRGAGPRQGACRRGARHHQSRHRPARFPHPRAHRRGRRSRRCATAITATRPPTASRRCARPSPPICNRRHGVEVNPDNVVVVPGGKPTMFFAILMFGEPGAEILYPNPGFPIYEMRDQLLRRHPGADRAAGGERLRLRRRGGAGPDHPEDPADHHQHPRQPDRRRHAEGGDRQARRRARRPPACRDPVRRDLQPDALRRARSMSACCSIPKSATG